MDLEALTREPAVLATPDVPARPSECGKTLAAAARNFVEALLNADLASMERISRSVPMGYPTRYVIREFRGLYAEYSLTELQFVVDVDGNRVSVRHRGQRVGADLRFKQLGEQYFFTHFDR